MKQDEHGFLKADGLRFFGLITASLSHEINNVLAIINEFGGLLNDVVYMAQQGKPLPLDKLERISDGISVHIKRGEELIKRLNRFAHSVDEPAKTVKINDLLSDITELCRRLASMRKVELSAELPDILVTVHHNPFKLMQMIYGCLEIAIGASQASGGVTIDFYDSDQGVTVIIRSDPIDKNGDLNQRMGQLSILAERLGAKITLGKESDVKDAFYINIPSVMPGIYDDEGKET